MISFKEYLSEAADIESEIDDYLNAGEIVKPKFEQLKSQINRLVVKDINVVKDTYLNGNHTDDAETVYYATSDNLNSIKALANLVKKLNPTDATVAAAQSVVDKYLPLHTAMAELKTKVVTTTQKRAEVKAVETKKQEKIYADATSLVGALMQHLNDFKQRAAVRAHEHIDRLIETLKANDWNIDKVAPRPHSRMTKTEYRMAALKRQMYEMITSGKDSTRTENKAARLKFVDQTVNAAHEDYMAWVHKMTQKIGKPIAHAKITGSPWTGSTLKVQAQDGEEQTWNTRMIINYSKYHKAFNQFPSRRTK